MYLQTYRSNHADYILRYFNHIGEYTPDQRPSDFPCGNHNNILKMPGDNCCSEDFYDSSVTSFLFHVDPRQGTFCLHVCQISEDKFILTRRIKIFNKRAKNKQSR